jgi:ArsR family transcriptional regulator
MAKLMQLCVYAHTKLEENCHTMQCVQVARILKALAEPTRLRLLCLLSQFEEICVCELTEIMELPQYHISRHLSVLRHLGLVVDHREGTRVHYRLAANNQFLRDLAEVLKEAAAQCPRAIRDVELADKVLGTSTDAVVREIGAQPAG